LKLADVIREVVGLVRDGGRQVVEGPEARAAGIRQAEVVADEVAPRDGRVGHVEGTSNVCHPVRVPGSEDAAVLAPIEPGAGLVAVVA
jgi:hypothetical protein